MPYPTLRRGELVVLAAEARHLPEIIQVHRGQRVHVHGEGPTAVLYLITRTFLRWVLGTRS